MNKLLAASILIFGVVGAGAANIALNELPGLGNAPEQAEIQRPDSEKILSELTAGLRLSSKQEERIGAAIQKKTKEFDKLLEKYDAAEAEERKWRDKVDGFKREMGDLNKSIPELVRMYLDDEQRKNYDSILEARKKPAVPVEAASRPEPDPSAVGQAPSAAEPVKPVRKKRLVRRKKLPVEPAPAAAGEEAPGQVMVDKDPGVVVDQEPAAPRKKRMLKKKRIPAKPAAGEIPAGPAGSAGTGKEAPVSDDAGSYP